MSKKVEPFFKYIKREYKPIAISEIPSHGMHASRTKKIKKPEDIQEATKPDLSTLGNSYEYPNPNKHIGPSYEDVHKELNLDSHEFEKKHGYDGRNALHRYSSASRDINKHLIDQHFGNEGKDGYETSALGPRESALMKEFRQEHKKSPWGKPSGVIGHPHEDHWNSAINKKNSLDDIEKNVKHLDKALNNRVGHELTVFHGTKNWHPGQEAAKHPDGHIMLPAYTSTSIHPNTAASFSSPVHTSKNKGHILKIHMSPEDKGVYLGDNSSFDNEKELLLPRKTVLKIHKTPEVYHTHEHHEEWDDSVGDVKTKKTKKKVFLWHAHIVRQGDDEHGN